MLAPLSNRNRTAVITGASSGIGAALAERLARQGWQLILINRSAAKTETLRRHILAENPQVDVTVIEADLADQAAVRAAGETVAQRYPQLDALFNNAGVLLGELRYSTQGNEMHFQVNTLAPYMLLRLLRASLAAAGHSVVVNVSSDAFAYTGRLRLDQLREPPRLRKLVGPYAQSKLALTTITNALAPEYRADGIVLRSMDPGAIKTAMTAGAGMPRLLLPFRHLFFNSPQQGAAAMYDAAFDASFGEQTGIFIAGGKIKQPPKDAQDTRIQTALLQLCYELTGL